MTHSFKSTFERKFSRGHCNNKNKITKPGSKPHHVYCVGDHGFNSKLNMSLDALICPSRSKSAPGIKMRCILDFERSRNPRQSSGFFTREVDSMRHLPNKAIPNGRKGGNDPTIQFRGSEWLRMVQNGSEWFRMAQNGSEWLRMVPNSSAWFRIALHGSE